jgi:hypothetical protein
MMARPARITPLFTGMGMWEIAFDANPPTPGMNDARLEPMLLKIEKNPGSPL